MLTLHCSIYFNCHIALEHYCLLCCQLHYCKSQRGHFFNEEIRGSINLSGICLLGTLTHTLTHTHTHHCFIWWDVGGETGKMTQVLYKRRKNKYTMSYRYKCQHKYKRWWNQKGRATDVIWEVIAGAGNRQMVRANYNILNFRSHQLVEFWVPPRFQDKDRILNQLGT